MKCKVCGKEGSEYDFFNEFIPQFQMHSKCIERAVEEGNLEVIQEIKELFSG